MPSCENPNDPKCAYTGSADCHIAGQEEYCESCDEGYVLEGRNCVLDTSNYCNPNPCQNGGTCDNGSHSYTCNCVDGYSGTNCETEPVCESTPGYTDPVWGAA